MRRVRPRRKGQLKPGHPTFRLNLRRSGKAASPTKAAIMTRVGTDVDLRL